MKKIFSSILTVLMLVLLASPMAAAQDIKQELMEFINETYELEPQDYQVSEVYEVELKYLELTLTMVTWHTDSERGQVAWVAETNEFLANEDIYSLMNKNYEIQAAEYRRLQEKAGNMDVWLYEQLLDAKADEVFEVVIIPHFNLTRELEKQIRDLYEEYDLEAPRDLNFRGGQVAPGFRGFDSGDDGTSLEPPRDSITPLPADKEVVTDPAEPAGSAEPEEKQADKDEPVSSDSGRAPYRPVPEEFHTKLAELVALGTGQSMEAITAHLDSLGAKYEVNPDSITASLTPQQVLDLREVDGVHWIGSYLGDARILPAAFGLDSAEPANMEVAIDNASRVVGQSSSSGNSTPFIIGGAILGVAAAAFIYLKKN